MNLGNFRTQSSVEFIFDIVPLTVN